MVRTGVTAGLTAVLVAVPGGPAAASVSQTPAPSADVTGTVYAIAHAAGRTFIAGDFTAVGGLARRNAAALNADGTVDPAWAPEPNGVVKALAVSADGSKVFLGGLFTAAGGASRSNLAAVNSADGAALPGWSLDLNNEVRALARSGEKLYVGGAFVLSTGGLTIRRLIDVDVNTGAVNTSFRPWPNWTVNGLAVAPGGGKIYAVGGFTVVRGLDRPGAVEINPDGSVTPFAPTEGGVVLAVAVTPDGSRLYYSTTSNRLHAYDPAVSNTPVYTVRTGGDTQAIAASATEVYFGGHFTRLSDFRLRRPCLASIRVADGTPTNWDPRPGGWYMCAWAVVTTSDAVLVGGDFTSIGSTARRGFARFPGTP